MMVLIFLCVAGNVVFHAGVEDAWSVSTRLSVFCTCVCWCKPQMLCVLPLEQIRMDPHTWCCVVLPKTKCSLRVLFLWLRCFFSLRSGFVLSSFVNGFTDREAPHKYQLKVWTNGKVRAVAFTTSSFIQCLLNICETFASNLVKKSIIHVGVVGGELCADSKFFTL